MDYPISTLDEVRPLLVSFRKKAGLSQAAVAARLGISQQAYARMEAHPTNASVGRLLTVLQLLGATVSFGRPVAAAAPPVHGLAAGRATPVPTGAASLATGD